MRCRDERLSVSTTTVAKVCLLYLSEYYRLLAMITFKINLGKFAGVCNDPCRNAWPCCTGLKTAVLP